MRPLPPPPAGQEASHRAILAIIIMATATGPLALNMPLPSMPGMAVQLGVEYGQIQLMLTLYLAALAVAQLIYGPLSDRYGRRPVLLAGIVAFIVGSLAAAVAPNLELLLAARVLQGAGGCAGMVIGRAILRDLFDRRRTASQLGYVTMAMVAAPMIAPAVGGVLDEAFGWRSGFFVLAATGIALIVVVFAWLPETHLVRTVGEGVGGMLRACRVLIAEPSFLAYVAIMSFTSAMFFAFLAGAPFIVVELMGRSPAEYGLWFISNAGGYMIGNFISGRYVERYGVIALMRIGTLGNLASIAILIAAMAIGPFVPLTLFLPMMLMAFANGLVMPNSIAAAVSVRPDLAGAASGLAGAMQMGLAAVVTLIVAAMQDDTSRPMIAMIAVCAAIAAAAFMAARRFEERR